MGMTSEKMTVICNIQTMNKYIHGTPTPFEELEHKTLEELRDEEERLIPLYNKSLKR